MALQFVTGLRYPVRYGPSMRDGVQVISVTVDDRVAQGLTAAGHANPETSREPPTEIYFQDGRKVTMHFQEKTPGDKMRVYVLVLVNNILYMESVGHEYLVSRRDMELLCTANLQSVAQILGKPNWPIVLSPESVKMEVKLTASGLVQPLSDIPDDASDITECSSSLHM